ncbi:MAG: DUF4167 domain-containing protein [Pseudomonadota bacterium]
MRSSQKSGRSRGKGNRNNSNKNVGHSPNRVYESAGPEGKVRGTPQQIIDKYLALARDAQLSGDRVTAENFLQHAEHYSRILVAAAEAAAERQNQQNANQQTQSPDQNQSGNTSDGADGGASGDDQRDEKPRRNQRRSADPRDRSAETAEQPSSDGLAAIDAASGEPSGIVETPESTAAPAKPRTSRPRPRNPKPKPAEADAPSDKQSSEPPAPEAAE